MRHVTFSLKFVITVSLSLSPVQPRDHTPERLEIIERVNRRNSGWTAGNNSEMGDRFQYVYGTFKSPRDEQVLELVHYATNRSLPKVFDARTNWPMCQEIISHVRDQGDCSSSWAVATASMLSDRTCIATNGIIKVHLSAEDIISCCEDCLYEPDSCMGGFNARALNFWKKNGIVSGGEYNSQEGCKPYSANMFLRGGTTSCEKECSNSQYASTYFEDKNFGKLIYRVSPRTQNAFMDEILRLGPVTSTMRVFEDFEFYTKGIYRHVAGKYKGHHLVKIIGWGEENNELYWLAVNSWGPNNWGEMGGLVKILRDVNEGGIENHVTAGRMKMSITAREELIVFSRTESRLQTTILKYVVIILCFCIN